MKYTSFKSDIIGIIHSSDNNYILKFYNNDGDTTIDEKNTKWLYIESENIMIEFPDENSTLTIWSSSNSLPKNFENIIQRIRHLSVLNGISLNTKLYNNLDRRKIYNIIKKSIIAKKENEMNESYTKLTKALCEVSQIIKNTKKESDFYVSESIHSKNISVLTESLKNILNGINVLNSPKISKLFDMIVLESSNKNISTIVKQFMIKCPNEFNILCENISTIKNVVSNVKNRFKNNIETKKMSNIQMVLENVIVYSTKSKTDNENLIKAYNHLVTISEGVTKGIDLLRVIKKHKLCETYKISKDTLLDFWLSKDIKEIKPQTLFVIEHSSGDFVTITEDMKPSLKLLSECINMGEKSDSILFNAIVDETVKFNHLTNLLENYSYNFNLKNYSKVLKKMYKESFDKITANSLLKENFNEIIIPYDYSKQLSLIESKLGFKHPGLKYIAMFETKKNIANSIILEKEQSRDRFILETELNKITSYQNSKYISESIVKNGINTIKELKNREDKFNVCKCLLNNTYSADEKSNKSLQECLYVMSTNPKTFTSKRKKFIETLLKYIR